MEITGIICEYNPFHLGHQKQLNTVRGQIGPDGAIVCLMSGNYVQRGHPAILDKSWRAQAALAGGADLVLEMPIGVTLSSAEGFAGGSVAILSRLCTRLSFGAETADLDALLSTAQTLLGPEFPAALRLQLDTGKSFPAARAAALTSMGVKAGILATPNNILAVEYCKAILSQGSPLVPFPIPRAGSYHAEIPEDGNPSATALRKLMLAGQPWQDHIPSQAHPFLTGKPLHTLEAGQRAILGRLRTMTEAEFSQLPYGSEGLWRKLMHASRSGATLDAIIDATKSKRYTRSRIDRMILCAFLGLTETDLSSPPPYTRVLGFNDRGREILRQVKKTGFFRNAGEDPGHPYWQTECRVGDLYGLFAVDGPEAPGMEENRRIIYKGVT